MGLKVDGVGAIIDPLTYGVYDQITPKLSLGRRTKRQSPLNVRSPASAFPTYASVVRGIKCINLAPVTSTSFPPSPTVSRRMLEKNRFTRITLHGAMSHEWVTREGVWHPQWDDGQDVRKNCVYAEDTPLVHRIHITATTATLSYTVRTSYKNRVAHVRYYELSSTEQIGRCTLL